MSTRRLLEAGYVYIGLDHFAKPDDELNLARRDGSLHRNFQGYTTRAECDLIGLGVSEIGKVGHSYSQSVRSLNAYYTLLEGNRLPIDKDFQMILAAVFRLEVLLTLMVT